jgi:hypothetical protein
MRPDPLRSSACFSLGCDMTLFSDLCTTLSIPADGIKTSASAGNKCLWTCTWRCKTPAELSSGATDPAYYTPDMMLEGVTLSQAQLSAELADVAALFGLDMPEPQWGFVKVAEEAARLKALVDQGEHLETARTFLHGGPPWGDVQEYAMSLRHYILPTLVATWGSQLGGQRRPGWEV